MHIQFGYSFKLLRFQTFYTSGIRIGAKFFALYYSGDAVCDGYWFISRYHDYAIKRKFPFWSKSS